MSDTTNQCPHCGYKKKKNIELKPKTIFTFSIWIGAILLLGSLIFPILECNLEPIRYDKSEFIWGCCITLFTIIGLIWVGNYYKKSISKAFHTVVVIIFADLILMILSFVFIGLENWEQKRARLGYDYYSPSINENLNSANNTTMDYIGTYEYTQPRNRQDRSKLTIKLNDDKTAVAVSQGKREKTVYGSWRKFNDGQIWLTFTDTDVHTFNGIYADLLVFTDWADQMDISNGVIYDGYLYENYSFAEAKNPEHRVKLEKIN